MRTLTVDTDGLFFSLRILVVAALLVGVWYAWAPLQQQNHLNAQTANAIGSGVMDGDDSAGAAIDESTPAESAATIAATEPAPGPVVRVDLGASEITLYQDEVVAHTAVVQMAPASDSPSAVPEGLYTVDLLSETQLSTVTLTRFPYYIKFGDRYALHGVPTGANGEGIDKGQGGGSIQLATEDAKIFYEALAAGAQVEVLTVSDVVASDTLTHLEVSSGDLPATTASSYALTDVETGQTFIVKNGGDRYPVASITKVVTAAVASDVIPVGDEVRSSNGQYYVASDLYYPLLLRSDNGVAHSLASHVGTAKFVSDMEAYVHTVGMQDTFFGDSSGLSSKNVSSANDLTLLARHLYSSKPFILDISSEESMTITSRAGVEWNMKNQNKLSADPYFRGGKLGYTDEAGQTSLALFTLPIDGESHLVSVVVLGSKDWKQDTRTLLRWLVQNVSAK